MVWYRPLSALWTGRDEDSTPRRSAPGVSDRQPTRAPAFDATCWSTLPVDLLPLVAEFAVVAASTADEYTGLALVSPLWAVTVREHRWATLTLGSSNLSPGDKLAVLLRDPSLASNVHTLSLSKADERGTPEMQADLAAFMLPLCIKLRQLEVVLQLKTAPLILRALQNPQSPAAKVTAIHLNCTAQTSRLDPAELVRALAGLASLRDLSLVLRPRAFDGALRPSSIQPPPTQRLALSTLSLALHTSPDFPPGDSPNPSHLSFLSYLLGHVNSSRIRALDLTCPTTAAPSPSFADTLLPSLPSLQSLRLTSVDNALSALLPRLPSLFSHLTQLQTLILTNLNPRTLAASPSSTLSFPSFLRTLPPSVERVFVQALFDERVDEDAVQEALQEVLHGESGLKQVDRFERVRPYGGGLLDWDSDDEEEEDDDEEDGVVATTLITGTCQGRAAWYRLFPPDPKPRLLCIIEPREWRERRP